MRFDAPLAPLTLAEFPKRRFTAKVAKNAKGLCHRPSFAFFATFAVKKDGTRTAPEASFTG